MPLCGGLGCSSGAACGCTEKYRYCGTARKNRRVPWAGEKAADFDEMVLSPQSDLDLVRQKLTEMGHTIDDEEMLIDEGKYYTVIRSVRNSDLHPGREHPKGRAGYTAELLYGPVLLEKRHPVLWEYLKKQEKTLTAILENLENAGRGPDDERYREVTMKMEVLREAQRYCECD